MQARHIYICDYHKSLIQSVRVRQRKRKDSEDDSNAETDHHPQETVSRDHRDHHRDAPEVDLFQLQINTLRRYKRHYKVPTRPGLNKAQLAEVWTFFSFYFV